MNMPTRHVEYEDERVKADLEIRQATVRDGIKRTMFMRDAEDNETGDLELDVLRRLVYPPLMAVTIGTLVVDGQEQEWPLDFETYTELPEALGIEWENAAFELNPHFWPRELGGEGEGEKKASENG